MVSTTLSSLDKTSSTSDSKTSPITVIDKTTGSTLRTPSSQNNQSNLSNDQISLLFPKCRPRSDVNLNTIHISGQSSPNLHSQATIAYEQKQNNIIKSSTRKIAKSPVITIENQEGYLVDNRLIVSEDFNKTEVNDNNNQNCEKQKIVTTPQMQKYNSYKNNQNPFMKDNDRNIWEMRTRSLNITPVNTVLNSPDTTELDTKLNYQKQQYHVKVGRSPVTHSGPQNSLDVQTPTKSVAVVADGEVVVFDDIDDNWKNLPSNTDTNTYFDNQNENRTSDDNKYRSSGYKLNGYGNESNYPEVVCRSFSNVMSQEGDDYINTETNGSGIIEYDGSPRRFGQGQHTGESSVYVPSTSKNHHTSNALFPPRPGFPQRIITTPESNTTITNHFNNADDTTNDVSEIENSPDFTISETKTSTFDYLYEFSETRKVLEEFFKCPANEDERTLEKLSDFNGSDVDSIDIHYEFRNNHTEKDIEKSYVGHRLAKTPTDDFHVDEDDDDNNDGDIKQNGFSGLQVDGPIENSDFDLFLDSASRSSGEIMDGDIKNRRRHSRCFRSSPETTDYDSNCGDLESEISLRFIGNEFGISGEFNGTPNYNRYYTSMPVLEDGLSSGHASDTENNNPVPVILHNTTTTTNNNNIKTEMIEPRMNNSPNLLVEPFYKSESPHLSVHSSTDVIFNKDDAKFKEPNRNVNETRDITQINQNKKTFNKGELEQESIYSINVLQLTPPPPAPAPHRKSSIGIDPPPDVQAALNDIRATIQRTKALPLVQQLDNRVITTESVESPPASNSPIWVPRCHENSGGSIDSEQPSKNLSADEEEPDTDLETDRLLGHQRLDDQGFYDDKQSWCDRKSRSLLSSSLSKLSPKLQTQSKNSGTSLLRQGLSSILPTTPETTVPGKTSSNLLDIGGSVSSPEHSETSPDKMATGPPNTDSPSESIKSKKDGEKKKKSKNKEVLIEGVLFRARYLGSTQLVCEGQPTKSTRMMQAEEAVSRIKSPDGENQPSTEVDLFISTEKIMVLNTDLKEIMMDHALRTISYIADIGDLVVLMARRRFVPQEVDDGPKLNRTPKMICHVFESEEAQFIAQSIGQAFQVAYMEFLKANGIEDHSFVKEMDYQEVLNSQEIFGDELEIFAKKELQKEVVVPKAKGEILGVVIVESGWGSMLPTVVIANLLSSGAAARCGQLNIGDQIIAINGLSLVGLPLSTCQTYIKNTKNQTVVKFTVVPCAPVVEVKIKRPNTKYQLGFSVQNGVICSLLRGGIAERGGVRVGHRIIEINNQSVVAVPHEKIVNLLATSVGEILMKTMPTSMFRLLTGQENPVYI